MKKTLVIILVYLISSVVVYGEKVVGNYTLSYFNKSYEIQASEIENGKFSIYIYVQGERKTTPVLFSIESDEVEKFNKSFLQISDKFREWRKVAKDNNVTDLRKDVDIKIPSVTIGWLSSEWHFSFRNSINARYIILEDGRDVMIIAKEATSATNKYIKQKIYWVFAEPEEIDDLVTELNVDKISAELAKVDEALDLFE